MTVFKFLIVASLCYCTYAMDLPSYIQKCHVEDPNVKDCVINSANGAIPQIVEGVPAFGIPLLDPFVGLTADIESAHLKLHVKNMNVSGLRQARLKDFSMKFEEGDFNFTVHLPKIILQGDYTVGGRILVVPIKGEGPMYLETDDAIFNVNLKCAFIDKRGTEYMDCKTQKVDFVVKKGYVELSNLFGNSDISKETNKVLNQNFVEVIKELAPSISDTVRAVADLIIQRFFDKASTNEIFIK